MTAVIGVVAFLLWVNFFPPLFSLILNDYFNKPLDGGLLFVDRKPIFGRNKTLRGIVCSMLGGVAVSPLIGIPWWSAGCAALLAMTGDLLSSFIKRRFDITSGRTVVVLDQIFESLFPALYLQYIDIVSTQQLLAAICIFVPVAYFGSRFWNYVNYRPPLENYPRIIRSTVRFREWRACHIPLARWQAVLNWTSILSNRLLLYWFFKLSRTYDRGVTNALNICVEEETLDFSDLPESFDGFRILLLTDLHLDGLESLTDILVEKVKEHKVDVCLIGGDLRMKLYGPIAPSLRYLKALIPHVRTRYGIFGVLGNHDCIEMIPDLEEAGVLMLVNDFWEINNGKNSVWVIGIDDPHYYKTDDIELASRKVPRSGFKILLAHSPEAYKKAEASGVQLYVCGHTHGGQICIADKKPIFTNSRAPRYTASGRWKFRGMTGYTSRGAGTSSVPLRFNCPGEISVITLRKKEGASGS